MDDLLDEIVLGSARGGKAGKPLQVEVVRSLTEADLPLLQSAPPANAVVPTIRNLRHSHHQLAQLLAKGLPQVEVGLITGYSQSYISSIKTNDPAFRELLAYYETQREIVFADMLQRMQTLGLEFVDELRERLHEAAADFTNREIMEAIDLLGIKTRPGAGGGGGNAPNVAVSVQFVSPQHIRSTESAPISADFIEIDKE